MKGTHKHYYKIENTNIFKPLMHLNILLEVPILDSQSRSSQAGWN